MYTKMKELHKDKIYISYNKDNIQKLQWGNCPSLLFCFGASLCGYVHTNSGIKLHFLLERKKVMICGVY